MATTWKFLVVLFSVPLVPQVAFWLTCFSQSHLSPGLAADIIFTNSMISNSLACSVQCVATGKIGLMDFMNCLAGRTTDYIVANHGWENPGTAIKATLPMPGKSPMATGPRGTYAFSHKASVHASATLNKDPDLFVMTLVQGLIDQELAPADLFPLVIQMNLDDPAHIARRKLIDEAFAALHRPPGFNIGNVPGVVATDLHNATAVEGAVSYVLFKSLFDLELDRDGVALVSDWLKVFKPCGVNACPFGNQRKTKENLLKIVRLVAASKGGKHFQDLATKKGMDPALRLQEVVFITLFAGCGGITDTTTSTIRYYNLATRALFRQDPRAFVLEAARLNPAVHHIGAVPEDQAITLGNGRSHVRKKGELVWNFFAAANVDPNVFGGPSGALAYAKDFAPNRENADRLVNWNGELRDILACDTTMGCTNAPRPCPGARLAVHVATQVATFFFDAAEVSKKEAPNGEL